MKRFVLIILLFVTSFAYSQDVVFKASAPNVVAVGEQFRLSYVINQSGSNLQIPSFTGFDLLMGPSTSQSSQISIINGKRTQSKSFTYTYVLEGVKSGKYQFSPATITIDGKKYRSNALAIEVVKGNSDANQKGGTTAQANTSNSVTEKNLFLKVDVSRRSLYLGESLLATIKIYSKVDLANFGRSKFPAFSGFLTEEVPTAQNITLARETYNGEIYNVGVIRKMLLFPQHTGEIKIDPFELECIVRQRLTGGGRSAFDDFFGNQREVRVMRRSKPVTIHVKELPQENKPIGFSGTVGNVTMSTNISTDTLDANEAITYKVTFSGSGNLKLLSAPKVDFPLDFESYDPKESRKIETSENGMYGTVGFEYVLIPRYGGEYKIPAVRFSYFDTKSKSYKTIFGKEYSVFVKKGDTQVNGGGGTVNAVQSFKKEEIRQVGEDIRYLKTGDLKLKKSGVPFFGTLTYWLSLLIPFVIFVLGAILNRRRIKANADVVKTKNRAATKMARKRLKMAATALKSRNSELFYDEVLKALWGYMSYKLNIDGAELNRDNMSELLMQKNVTEDLQKEFIQILDACEFARYAPGRDRKSVV